MKRRLPSEAGTWFRCKGCGQPAAYFEAGVYWRGRQMYAPGSIMHAKGLEKGARVQCPLYHQTDARTFWALHEDAERIDPPTDLAPIVD